MSGAGSRSAGRRGAALIARAVAAAAAAAAAVSAPAAARAGVVIEAYVGERPADASAILEPILAGFRSRGFYTRAEQAATLYGVFPLPGRATPPVTAADVLGRIDLGVSRVHYGKHDEAIHLLERAIHDLRASPAMTVALDDPRKWVTKATAALVRAYLARGKASAAAEVLHDLVRSFPEWPLERAAYGPTLADLYARTRAELDAERAGRITLSVDQPHAEIFVNELLRAGAGLLDRRFAPGAYRVLIRVDQETRRYVLRVRPGEDTKLHVPWHTDTALITSPAWLGFHGPRRPAGELAELAARLAQQNPGRPLVVLGIARAGARRYVTARRFQSDTGEYLDGVSFPITGRDAAAVQALLARVIDGTPSALIGPLIDELPAARGAPPPWRAWAAGAGALGAGAAGAYLLTRAEASGATRAAGAAVTAAGIGAAIASGYLFYRAYGRRERRVTAGLAPARGGGIAVVHGAF